MIINGLRFLAAIGLFGVMGVATAAEAPVDESTPHAAGRGKDGVEGRHEGKGPGNMKERPGMGMMGGGMRPGMGREPEGMMLERLIRDSKLAKEIGLTDEQIASLKEKMDALAQKDKELMEQLKQCGMEQVKLVTQAEKIDENAVMAAVEKTGALRTEMAKNMMRRLILAKQTLTPEQVQKLKGALREGFQKRAGGKEGEGKGNLRREPMRKPRPGPDGEGPQGHGVRPGDKPAPPPSAEEDTI